MASDFVQIHLLTSYPPSNLNRDDLGRPKTAVVGGVQRLRISSQSLKRAWRTSPVFQEGLTGHVGTRTKEIGNEVLKKFEEARLPAALAKESAAAIAAVFGKLKKDEVGIEQLAHVSPAERDAVDALVKKVIATKKKPAEHDLNLLRKDSMAVDIALFGRMLAAYPDFNVEAAAQVAHAITVHEVAVEDDYFTAVDDLNRREEDMGAGHVGEAEFAAGLFYLYACLNWTLLMDNLGGNADLAVRSMRALVEAAAKVAPRGKQASFASRAYASFILAEKGQQQPRSLSVAFLKPVGDRDYLAAAIEAIRETRQNMEKVYGKSASETYEMDASAGNGSFAQLLDFVSSASTVKR